VPFADRPEIHEGNADFFDQLALITAPVFVQTCRDSGGWGCGAKSDAVGGLGEAFGGQSAVQVWEQGEVGNLDYAILSAGEGDDLVSWLQTEGYGLPAGADALLATMHTEGLYFFVSRLSADADPSQPIAPVRFVMPVDAVPAYPLRLTALGAPAGEVLDLTLWVIYPDGQGNYLPRDRELVTFQANPTTAAEYQAEVDSLFEHAPTGVALLYAEPVARTSFMDHLICESTCVTYEEVGLNAPTTWCSELEEMSQDDAKLLRLEARLTAEAMATDLELHLDTYRQLEPIPRMYEHSVGKCDESGCATATSSRRQDHGLLLGLALVLLGALRRARSRRQR
jgi:hypothetical protein